MKIYIKRALLALSLAILLAAVVPGTIFAAAKKTTLETKKLSVQEGSQAAVKLVNPKKGAVYSYISNKNAVAKVNKKGIITGVKKGTAKITVKQTLNKKTTKIGVVTVKVKALKTEAKGISLKGSYAPYVNAYDDAAKVYQVMLVLDQEVDGIKASDIKVSETKTGVVNWDTFETGPITVDRDVVSANLVDAGGERVSTSSKNVMLGLKVSYDAQSVFAGEGAFFFNVWNTDYHMNFELSKDASLTSGGEPVAGLVVEDKHAEFKFSDDVNRFSIDSFKASDGVEYGYACYSPENASDTLVVWLHGLGEGGAKTYDTDPVIPLIGAEAVALARDEFQGRIGGAHILVPQCPTFWMDLTGEGTEINQSVPDSFYADSLDELIDAYAKKAGAKKIVIAGCSNGGFMTMIMALRNPAKYAAIIPVCEALEYSADLNEKLDAIKDLPMYFVYSEDDGTVIPSAFEIPTIEYLKNINAANLHVSVTDHVYLDYEGQDSILHNNGHFSWVYFFNNTTDDGTGLTAWDWLADVLNR